MRRTFCFLACSIQMRCLLLLHLLASVGGTAHAAPPPLSGVYTINNTLPTAGNNFNTFTEAIFALADGVSGPVTFNVAPGSGPYNEQLIIPAITGASATNTITFNGNGATLQFLATNNFNRAGVKLDGADHIIFDGLIVKPLATDVEFEFGYGFHLIRNADHAG